MTKTRRRFSPEFKFRVALEAAKGTRTISELATEYRVHPNQISQWKRQLLQSGADVFSQSSANGQRDQQAVQTELYEQIGRLKMELEWVKKSLPSSSSPEAKRALIEPHHLQLSIRRQCELLGLNRSTWYYLPTGHGISREPAADAAHRRAVFAHAVLRLATHDGSLAPAGLCGQLQACPAADALAELAGHLSEAQDHQSRSGKKELSLFAARTRDRPAQLRLEC